MSELTIRMTQAAHTTLKAHLFPGDRLEASALMLCKVARAKRTKYLVRELMLVPHDACQRQRDALTWPGEYVEQALAKAEEEGLAVIAAHSHPGGLLGFSAADDASDTDLMPAMAWRKDCAPGSAIMTGGGEMRVRIYEGTKARPALVLIAGHDIAVHGDAFAKAVLPFTSEMTERLGAMTACVVGVSGTGSIVAEQLGRLGFGEIILIDFDHVEKRNLNRILNSRVADLGQRKVDMFAAAIRSYRPDCQVHVVPRALSDRDAILAASDADVLFCCVDTDEGRQLADRTASAFLIPLVDMGVSIPTRRDAAGAPQVIEVCGRVDYVFPGSSTLSDRGVYTPASLEAEYLKKHAPRSHATRMAEGYIKGVIEEAPAVIALNMRAASAAVMEFIARAFPFRHEPNENFARAIFLLAEGCEERTAESAFDRTENVLLGCGDERPLLGLPALETPMQSIAR
ncbi:MAG: ThiF family adenylyltransferase [Terricaulis sp.]